MIVPVGLLLKLKTVDCSGGRDVVVTGDTFRPELEFLSMMDE